MAQAPETNYFVCTLGEAQALNASRPNLENETVSDVLHERAIRDGDLPAVGFPNPHESANRHAVWQKSYLTFSELYLLSSYAIDLKNDLADAGFSPENLVTNDSGTVQRTSFKVALLCSSNTNFLSAWTGLMRLGLPVLLIGPQNQPSSIVRLCQSEDEREDAVKILYFDNDNESLAQRLFPVNCRRLPVLSKSNMHANKIPAHYSKPSDVAYIHHSSGTSSGVLKPINQTHRAAVGVLPRLDGRNKACFSTTPLYHGGVADCLRAWTSRAMIWLFPENEIPITAANVLKCLEFIDTLSRTYVQPERMKENGALVDKPAKTRSEGIEDMNQAHKPNALKTNRSQLDAFPRETIPQVEYFSCVPYVLNIIVQEKAGQDRLRRMGLVGIGGTALSQADGNRLVKEGIRLISRYGSAECGFLMSSYRQSDDEWQFLRVPKRSKYLQFEDVHDGLVELIVRIGWPHMAKRNLSDGSYATSDLFERHPKIEQAWKYHSRKDSLITLSTGKKFDPEPLERSLLAVSKLIRDVLVFGSGRSYPGALLLCELNDGLDEGAFLDQLWPDIDEINHSNPPHVHLQRTALTFNRTSGSSDCLPKSSKGSTLRNQAEVQYQKFIENVYDINRGESTFPSESDLRNQLSSAAIHDVVADTVRSVLGKSVNDDADLLREGLKSQQSTEIRNVLSSRLLKTRPSLHEKISLTVAYDQETIEGLSQHYELYLNSRFAKECTAHDVEQGETQEMMQLKQRRISTARCTYVSPDSARAIILTGATGTLGVHLLDAIRVSFPRHRIYCLLRSRDGEETSAHGLRNRLSAELEARNKAPLSAPDNVTVMACEASKARFGLDERLYNELAATASLIVHAAWSVNFAQPLRAFKDQFAWLVSLLELGHQATFSGQRVGFFFCSSIASISQTSEPSSSERISVNPQDATSVGYSRSKWVAEQICLKAYQDSNKDHKGLDVHVLRIGQLCSDTVNGIWNMREAVPLLLSTKDILGCLPKQDSEVDWLPVDIAARSIIEIISSANNNEGQSGLHGSSKLSDDTSSCHVYHVLNPRPHPAWDQMLEWINEDGMDRFQIVDGHVWFRRLEEAFQNPNLEHPSRSLLPLWDRAYNQKNVHTKSTKVFESTKARNSSPTLEQAMDNPVITRELVSKIGKWIGVEMRIDRMSTSFD